MSWQVLWIDKEVDISHYNWRKPHSYRHWNWWGTNYTAHVWKCSKAMWFRFSGVCWWNRGSKTQLFPAAYYELERTARPVKAEFSIGRRYSKTMKLKTLREMIKTNSRIIALELRKTDIGLLRICLAESCRRLPWRAKRPKRTSW